ncbi:MAG TPA: ABC transporter permease [Acidimicrobiales bacterium]|jgi:lipopolysaccharide transport system permease protein|nr:ABC transporter permease [Acidimicrobiales bacterium]
MSALAAVRTRRVRHAVDLVHELVLRDLRLRYRRSVLGIAWSQLSPLALLAVLTFVFTKILPLQIPRYALFVYAGLLPWTWFSGALTDGANAIVWSRDLVRRPGVPVAFLPVTTVVTHLAYFALSLPVLFVGLTVDGGIPATALLLPCVVAVQFVLLLGPVYLLASLQVSLRDTGHLVGVVLVPVFYATPVFYQASSVPDRYRWVYDANPAAILITAYRDVLLEARAPELLPLAVLAAIGIALAMFGRRMFERSAHRFAEELG